MSATMTAVVCQEPGLLQVQEVAAPNGLSDNVRIRIKRIGVCGTDFHIFKGMHPFLEYPRVMGHELAGIVEDPGRCSTLSAGDRVVVNPYLPCNICKACRREKPNCCANIRVLGVHTNGGMCELVDVPESALYPIHDLSLTHAAMIEFLAIGAHAVSRATLGPDDKVLVIGAGPIGIGVGLFARQLGAEVCILDTNASRTDRAVKLTDAALGLTVNDDTADSLAKWTNDEFVDVVFDATGNRNSMQKSLDYVAHGGKCVFVSVVNETITFDDPSFHAREITLLGSRNAVRSDFEKVISAMRSGTIPTDKLNTHDCALEDVPAAMPDWLADQDRLIKGIIRVE